jgi:hypothetical protein
LQELQQFPWLQPSLYSQANTIIIAILLAIALVEILSLKAQFNLLDRMLLFITACIYMGLQYTYGLQEILHMPLSVSNAPQSDPLSLYTFNLLLAGIPTISALVFLFIIPKSSRLNRLPLLLLAFAYAALQEYLGQSVSVSLFSLPHYPLTMRLQNALNINQLIMNGLLAIALLLLFRLTARFSRLDRVALYCVAIVCTLIQVSAWDKTTTAQALNISRSALLTLGIANATNSQFYIVATNKLLALLLEIIVIGALVLMGGNIFAHLLQQYRWPYHIINRVYRFFSQVDRFSQLLDHSVVLIVTITCVLLQLFFGAEEYLLSYSLNLQVIAVTSNQVAILLLILAAIFALFRLTRPFGNMDRFIVLIDAIACMFLFFRNSRGKHFSFSAPGIQQWVTSPHLGLPSLYIAIGLLLTALISFVWLKRSFPAADRSLLLILFGLALLCALLQIAGYIFVVAALIVLLHGVLLATRVEEIR